MLGFIIEDFMLVLTSVSWPNLKFVTIKTYEAAFYYTTHCRYRFL